MAADLLAASLSFGLASPPVGEGGRFGDEVVGTGGMDDSEKGLLPVPSRDERSRPRERRDLARKGPLFDTGDDDVGEENPRHAEHRGTAFATPFGTPTLSKKRVKVAQRLRTRFVETSGLNLVAELQRELENRSNNVKRFVSFLLFESRVDRG